MNTRRAFFINTLSTASALAAAKSTNIESRLAKKDWRGITREDLPTPSMVIDIDLFEKNLNHMSSYCKTAGLNFRGHVKIHKSVDIARRQVALGSIGVTVATEAEAELMSGSGIKGVLLTRQPAGKEKTNRVVALAKRDNTFITIVDDPLMAQSLDEAAGAARTKVNVIVDVFAGLKRAGIAPGDKALALVQDILKNRNNLAFHGLMAYSGGASHTNGWEARKAKSMKDIAGMLETAEMCKKSGIPVNIRSGGSTGTYNIDPGHLTELQAGSYMFMDTGYIKIGSKAGNAIYDDFAQSLTILTTAIVRQHPGTATIDCGIKGMLKVTDTVKGRPDMKVEIQGAEYGILVWSPGDRDLPLGSKVELYPTHLDSTTNVYDRYYIAKGESIVDAWPVMGRAGAAQR
jgi:D-serine deaminase-like pyridoxal phosphate-dependent protein